MTIYIFFIYIFIFIIKSAIMHANLNSYSHQNPPFLSYKFFICIFFSSFFSRLIPSNPIQGIRNTMSRVYYEFIENYKLFIIFTNNNNDEGDDHHNATNVFFFFFNRNCLNKMST